MAFTLPTFNLTANIWNAAIGPPNPPDIVTAAALMAPRKNALIAYALEIGSGDAIQSFILLPALTDIRDGAGATAVVSLIELPAGSGRFYSCEWFDDVAKGYPNEYRLGCIGKVPFSWPEPAP
jgi:hypothetical protein